MSISVRNVRRQKGFFATIAAGTVALVVASVALAQNSSAAVAETRLFANADTSTAKTFHDGKTVEVGMVFEARKSGEVTSLHFLKSGDDERSTHEMHLWTLDGRLIATAKTTNETSSGWQTATFDKPIQLKAGQQRVASYNTNHYMASQDFFMKSIRNATLRAPAKSNGRYAYGQSVFPNESHRRSNYWLDVTFRSGTKPAQTPGASTTTSIKPSELPVTTSIAPSTTVVVTSVTPSIPTTTPKPSTTTVPKPAPTTVVPTSTTAAPSQSSARPGSGNTGVPASKALSALSNGSITTDGTVIDGKSINGTLKITADNVVVRNSKMGSLFIQNARNVTVEDSTTGSVSISSSQTINLKRLNIGPSNGGDSIHVTSDNGSTVSGVLIANSWIHDPNPNPGDHYDGIQVRGVNGLQLIGNYFDLGNWTPEVNAAIFLEDANGGNSNVKIDGNWIDGGGYMFYIAASNTSITNNKIGRLAHWGLLYVDSPFTQSGNVWMDNGSSVTIKH